MDYYVDIPPTPSPSVFYASQAAMGGPKKNTDFGATRFLSTDYARFNSLPADVNTTEKLPKTSQQIDSTALLPKNAEIRPLRSQVEDRQVLGREKELSKIAEDRIKLLAFKYANDTISAEMIARLEILNSRLLERSPRISREQISVLESSIDSIKSIEQSRLDRAKRLGLTV